MRQDTLLLRRTVLELDELGTIDSNLAHRELTDQIAGLHAGVADIRALTTSIQIKHGERGCRSARI